jgi:CheY-like chemotaxis protein
MHPWQIRETFDFMADLLPRTLGSKVVLSIHAQPALPQIYADPSMLETMLINLSVSACNAMPEGGKLTLSAEMVELDAKRAAKHLEGRPGRFLRISVADEAARPGGKASSLAHVQEIVREHLGWIERASESDKGTHVDVYLPSMEARKEHAQARPATAAKPVQGGVAKNRGEMILVVEDEPDLCELITQLLQSRGYKTVAASSGKSALEQWAIHKDEIQLLLTDMVMPDGMTGRKLAETLQADSPNLAVIYTSGHSQNSEQLEIAHIDPQFFLGKPYRPAQLFDIVERCFHRPPSSSVEAA